MNAICRLWMANAELIDNLVDAPVNIHWQSTYLTHAHNNYLPYNIRIICRYLIQCDYLPCNVTTCTALSKYVNMHNLPPLVKCAGFLPFNRKCALLYSLSEAKSSSHTIFDIRYYSCATLHKPIPTPHPNPKSYICEIYDGYAFIIP
jgi:hypothetical protein